MNIECSRKAQKRFDNLIKPVGSLGKLEKMICRYCAIQEETDPGIIAYPQRVVLLFYVEAQEELEKYTSRQAPLAILCQNTGSTLIPVKIPCAPLTSAEYRQIGGKAARQAVGEGNTLIALAAAECKTSAKSYHAGIVETMTGAILEADQQQAMFMLDGLASVQAAAEALQVKPNVRDYLCATQITLERGQEELVHALALEPVLRLHFTIGVGYGATLAFTLFDAGLRAYKEMATFGEAGVHEEMQEFSQAQVDKKEKV